MKPFEILSSIPKWAKLAPSAIVASPAWAMPCRLGDRNCTMRLDAACPADTLDIAIRLGDDEHVLGLSDSERFPELHAVWSARAEMPEPILLALVEKDCGPLLQLIENAAHRQLGVIGIAEKPSGRPDLLVRISSGDEDITSFKLSSSPDLMSTFGQLRYIDVTHPTVREDTLPAETEYAAFALLATDIATLAPGDALVLPEIGSIAPRFIVNSAFLISENGVAQWKDEGILRVVAAEDIEMPVGHLMDCTAEGAKPEPPPAPVENARLRLMRLGKDIATGHLDRLGDQYAFILETSPY